MQQVFTCYVHVSYPEACEHIFLLPHGADGGMPCLTNAFTMHNFYPEY
jgi:hypothetical protein